MRSKIYYGGHFIKDVQLEKDYKSIAKTAHISPITSTAHQQLHMANLYKVYQKYLLPVIMLQLHVRNNCTDPDKAKLYCV